MYIESPTETNGIHKPRGKDIVFKNQNTCIYKQKVDTKHSNTHKSRGRVKILDDPPAIAPIIVLGMAPIVSSFTPVLLLLNAR